MLECSETVTVYNKYVDNGCERWKRTLISGVSWHGKQQVSVSTEGITSADMAIVRIPEASARDYHPAMQWLTHREGWTLQECDVIIRGVLDIEVTPGESVSKVLAVASESMAVQSVGDNRRGGIPHIKVAGGVRNANSS